MITDKELKKVPDVELATMYKRLERVCFRHENIFYSKFAELHRKLRNEIHRRNRAYVYKQAVKCLKVNKYENRFQKASNYVDEFISSCDYFTTDETHEIKSSRTKWGHPVLVDLVCYWSNV